jgi:hypothetical protein
MVKNLTFLKKYVRFVIVVLSGEKNGKMSGMK